MTLQSTTRRLLTLTAFLALGCDARKQPPIAQAGGPASPAAQYEHAVRASLLIATRKTGEKEGPEAWLGCSGVLVDRTKRLALTAHHCVYGRADGTPVLCFFMPATEPSHQLSAPEVDALLAGTTARCSILRDDADVDLTVVHLEDSLPNDAVAIELASHDPAIGDPVHGVLAPHLLANTWFTGYVNNRLTSANMKMAPGFAPRMMFGFTSPVSHGASGGMVLDEDGRLVGVTIASVHDTATGIAIPVSTIAERLKSVAGG